MSYSQQQRQRLFEIVSDHSSYSVKEERDSDGITLWALCDGCGDQEGYSFEYFDDLLDFVTNDESINNAVAECDVLNPVLITA